jgi:Xaa-Pro aminopeptidase
MSAGAGPERIERVRERMRAAEIDLLLLINSLNVVYLSGCPEVDGNLARPFFLLVPAEQDPVLLVHKGRENEARAYTWMKDVRSYRHLSRAPVEEIVEICSTVATPHARVGAELGLEQRPGIPPLELRRIEAALAPLEIVDFAAALWDLRAVKSEPELAALREACAITSRAYEETFRESRGGEPENRVRSRMLAKMAAAGGESPWTAILSDAGSYDIVLGIGSERPLVTGDLIWMDGGCSVGGLCSDFSRAGVVGGPSAQQAEAQRLVHEVTMRGVEMVAPGVPVREIATTLDHLTSQLDLAATSEPSRLAGRVGHGLGLNFTEPPHVGEHDPTILVPGMVITIEPGICTEYGMFHVEENVIVTESGHEVISSAPWQLATIPEGFGA